MRTSASPGGFRYPFSFIKFTKIYSYKGAKFLNQDAQAFSSNQLDCGDTHFERQRCACSFAALERIAFGGRVQRAPLRNPPRHLDPLAHCRQ
jgi:hypothetical protein